MHESAGAPTQGAVPPLYFERQRAARCGLHALNNALGGELITADDMSQACTAYLAEMAFEGLPHPLVFHSYMFSLHGSVLRCVHDNEIPANIGATMWLLAGGIPRK